jgi:hypothetical protein
MAAAVSLNHPRKDKPASLPYDCEFVALAKDLDIHLVALDSQIFPRFADKAYHWDLLRPLPEGGKKKAPCRWRISATLQVAFL